MKKVFINILAVCAAFALSATARAEGEAVHLSLEKIYRESQATSRIRETLDNEFAQTEGYLRNLSAEAASKREQLQKDSLTMSETDRASIIADIERLQRELERGARALREDRGARELEEKKKIDARLQQIINEVAAENKYGMVVVRAALLFADPKSDITDEVMKRLDADPPQ